MAYDTKLADRVRAYLVEIPNLKVEEKLMFGGLAFMVNGKMSINVSQDNLMCRFDPALQNVIADKKGYHPMIMKGKEYKGYCYISPEGIETKQDFEYFVNVCLEFNERAKLSRH